MDDNLTGILWFARLGARLPKDATEPLSRSYKMAGAIEIIERWVCSLYADKFVAFLKVDERAENRITQMDRKPCVIVIETIREGRYLCRDVLPVSGFKIEKLKENTAKVTIIAMPNKKGIMRYSYIKTNN